MKYPVVITPDAESDLRAIYRYLRKHAPLVASAWVKGARKAIRTLGEIPERGHLAAEAGSFEEPIRELLYGKGNRGTYRILYGWNRIPNEKARDILHDIPSNSYPQVRCS